jgi:hypothetical protein
MIRAMRFANCFGLSSLQGFVTLALACCACSSEGHDSGAGLVPPYSASNAPSTSEAPSTDGSESAAVGPSPGDSPAPAPSAPTPPQPTPAATSSEVTATPQLEPPPQPSGGANAGDESGMSTEPSARCGSGGASLSFNLPNTLFSVPASYDGVTPLPVVIAFHAAGNPNTQLQGILGNSLADEYIVFYPKSDGNGWSNQADPPKVDAIFAALDATACYDKSRVFATGHSSGAQFIVQRLCAGESRWRAVAPVASSVYCSSWKPIPALVIHGIGDTERQAYGLNDGDGLKDIIPYRTSNGCSETYTELPVQGCNSAGVQVNPGCRDFDGCTVPTRWCQHNDPQYGTSHHGVPCFGARVIKDFFDTFQ